MTTGFSPEMMEFFLSLRFNNNQEFFEENRARYQLLVQQPMRELAHALEPALLEIDPQLDVRPARVVSRIRRDTRFSRNKDPYRDHMWLAWRHAGETVSDAMSFYWEVSPEAMHWGFGFYAENRATMDRVRRGMLAEPRALLALYARCGVPDRFSLQGDAYKRMTVPVEVPDALRPLYCKKGFYLENTEGMQDFDLLYSGEIARRLREDFHSLGPLYRWMRGRRGDEEI